MSLTSDRIVIAILSVAALAACAQGPNRGYPYFNDSPGVTGPAPPAVIRQPVVPEMLVQCRGHVLVPALGMNFVPKGETAPGAGQYMREENLTAPYRVLLPGAIVTKDYSAQRLNVELDAQRRIIGLYCG